jgi:hypothetical protein
MAVFKIMILTMPLTVMKYHKQLHDTQVDARLGHSLPRILKDTQPVAFTVVPFMPKLMKRNKVVKKLFRNYF